MESHVEVGVPVYVGLSLSCQSQRVATWIQSGRNFKVGGRVCEKAMSKGRFGMAKEE